MADRRLFHTAAISAADINAVAAMEQRCFPTPWSPASCAAELCVTGGGGYVAAGGPEGTIAGYLFYRIMTDEMHIMKVATDPPWRHRRIASKLLRKALALAGRRRLRQVCLEVRASNIPAIQLYEKHGFELSGIRPAYYDNREDAVLMTKNIEEELLTWQPH